MMSAPAKEPPLTVRSRPTPFFRRRRFLRAFTPAGVLAVVGLVALLVSGNLLLPFERLVTLEGKMASKADFFDDGQVREILLRHHLRVQVTRVGSYEAVTSNLDSADFVFPSGQPTARLLTRKLRDVNRSYTVHRPFVSPIVLATYREYAETLRRAGVATPQSTQPIRGVDQPYYYDLDLARFLDLFRQQKTWDDLGISAFGHSNGNQVLAQTTDMCTSNSGATYLGLVASLTFGGAPTTEQEAVDLANKIKPLLRAQGLPVGNPEIYLTPEGHTRAPIIVLYEHQYLAHQLRSTEPPGALDNERVLLYPSTGFQTEPEFIALTEHGNQLGDLITTDPELLGRATELGFRVLDPTSGDTSKQLPRVLAAHGVPVPSQATNTVAVLPDEHLLERMISIVGDCA